MSAGFFYHIDESRKSYFDRLEMCPSLKVVCKDEIYEDMYCLILDNFYL